MSLTDALLLDPYRDPREVFLAERTDGAGCGTRNDPYGISTPERFDAIMRSLAALGSPVTVYLGPGTFKTYGYTDAWIGQVPLKGWEIAPGMRICGAGINTTVLEWRSLTGQAGDYYAIGHRLSEGEVVNPVDFAEVRDLRIDCGFKDSIPVEYSCGAIRLMGDHVRIRNVRATNWGTVSASRPSRVFSLISGHEAGGNIWESNDAGMENCVADIPSANMLDQAAFVPGTLEAISITVLHVGTVNSSVRDLMGKVPFIRNCFVDCSAINEAALEGINALKLNIRAIAMSHCLGGLVEGNQIHDIRIGGPASENAHARDLIVRSNTYKNVLRGPWWKVGGLSNPIGDDPLPEVAKESKMATIATVTTSEAHALLEGSRVIISSSEAPAYNGVFVVRERVSETEFTIRVPASSPPSATLLSVRKLAGFSTVLVEKNLIELAPGNAETLNLEALEDEEVEAVGIEIEDNRGTEAALHTPDFDAFEAIVRENHIRYLNTQFESDYAGTGIRIAGVKAVIVADNVLECAPSSPIQHRRCGTATYRMNRRLDGTLILGVHGLTDTTARELETDIEDALLLSLL